MSDGYNIEHYGGRDDKFERWREGPKAGARAPTWVAWELGSGRQVHSTDFLGKKNLVLEFGSIT